MRGVVSSDEEKPFDDGYVLQMTLQPRVGLGLRYNMPPGLSVPCSISPFIYTHLSQVHGHVIQPSHSWSSSSSCCLQLSVHHLFWDCGVLHSLYMPKPSWWWILRRLKKKTDGRNVITLLKVSRVESGWNWLRVMPRFGFPYWRRQFLRFYCDTTGRVRRTVYWPHLKDVTVVSGFCDD